MKDLYGSLLLAFVYLGGLALLGFAVLLFTLSVNWAAKCWQWRRDRSARKHSPEQIARDTENLRRSHQVKDAGHVGPGTLRRLREMDEGKR